MKIKQINKILPLINTFVLLVGGPLAYFLVSSKQVTESVANTELAQASTELVASEIELNQAEFGALLSEEILREIEIQLAPTKQMMEAALSNSQVLANVAQTRLADTEQSIKNLELELARTNKEIAELSGRSAVSLDMSSLLQDIQPNYRWSKCKAIRVRNEIEVSCTQENIGSHRIVVATPSVWITDNVTRQEIDKDSYEIRGLERNSVMPANSGSTSFFISGNPRLFQGSITIHIRVQVSTTDAVVDVVRQLIGNTFDEDVFEGITSLGFTMNLDVDNPL